MTYFDINTALGHWPFQQLLYNDCRSLEKRLREYGIGGSLVVNTHGLFYRDVQNANIELAEWIKGNPFFTGCASVNPAYPQWEKDLHVCVEEFGFKALRLTPLYHGYEVNGREMDSALCAAEKLGIPVLIPQRIMDLRQRHHLDVADVVLPETVMSLAEKHPLCRIICTETLFTDDDLPRLVPLENLYVESSRQLAGFSGLFRRIVDAVGADRVIFGSGAPFKEILPAVIKIKETLFTGDELKKVVCENSMKLLDGGVII